jgi:hypothetical protein
MVLAVSMARSWVLVLSHTRARSSHLVLSDRRARSLLLVLSCALARPRFMVLAYVLAKRSVVVVLSPGLAATLFHIDYHSAPFGTLALPGYRSSASSTY